MAGSASGYDWEQPFRPPGLNFWIAGHRSRVRSVLFGIDLVLVAMVVASLLSRDVWWLLYLQLPLWASLTYQFGWLLPASVDGWRSAQGRPAPPAGPSPPGAQQDG